MLLDAGFDQPKRQELKRLACGRKRGFGLNGRAWLIAKNGASRLQKIVGFVIG